MLQVAALIMTLALFGVGVKAIFNQGYYLFGGRESFGWGARIAGLVLWAPAILTTVLYVVRLKTRFIENEVWVYVASITASLVGFVISYTIAEMTYVPYWMLSRREEERNQAAEEDEEDLSERAKRKRQEKLEKKLAKARELDEKLRREREEEEERLKERQERAKMRKAPPPMPRDDDDRGRRRR